MRETPNTKPPQGAAVNKTTVPLTKRDRKVTKAAEYDGERGQQSDAARGGDRLWRHDHSEPHNELRTAGRFKDLWSRSGSIQEASFTQG